MARRRPVPREWRDAHHSLRTTTQSWGRGFRRVSRTRGTCSCGAQWPGPGANNLRAADVRDRWLDHVEVCYYQQPDDSGRFRIERHSRRQGWFVLYDGGEYAGQFRTQREAKEAAERSLAAPGE